MATNKSNAALKKFTVVAFYEDNSQPYVAWEFGINAESAIGNAKASVEHPIQVVEVFEGHHKGVAALDEVL